MGHSIAAHHDRPRAALVDEHEVRAAAGLTMVIGAAAFAYAYFNQQYVPLQVAASLFFAEFLIRVTAGLRYSPIGVLARAMTLGRAPEWVSAKPKRFAWTLGLLMALAMTVITNSGIRGPLPRSMCVICLTLMWMESALGLCLGCKIYGLLTRRGWIGADPEIEVCADGSCGREPEPVRASSAARVTSASGVVGAALAIGAVLVFVSPAAAAPRPIGPPQKSWSVSKIERGLGKVPIGHPTQSTGRVDKLFDLGPDAFDFKLSPLDGRAAGKLFAPADHRHGVASNVLAQAPSLDPFDPRSVEGSATHLDESQVYENGSRDTSLRLTSDVSLEMVDENGPLTSSECPVVGTAPCPLLRSIVHYRVRAWTFAGGHPFFDVGGAVYGEGHEHAWDVGVATDPRSRGPFWKDAQFHIDADQDRNGSGRRFQISTFSGPGPIEVKIPLRSLASGQLFVVNVSMDAETIDERGLESAASAFSQDPPHAGPGLPARALNPRRAPKFTEPPVQPRPAARCPAGPRPHAGTVQLSSRGFTVGEGSDTPLVLVTRTGGSRGATSVTVKTSGGTARSGTDFKPTRTLVRFENGDTSPRLVEIPIREDLTRERPESFTVKLSDARCAKLGKQRSASVTILDDDQPPPPPAPTFTIGGTVDGLQGSGLVLSTVGSAPLPVSANGSFTFPGTASDGQSYEVKVATQPHNPDQVCTVQNGAGHIAHANVSDIAVHCALLATPSGLDTTFGSGGRVSTPVGDIGQGQAVVIQPNGGIVTAGSRQIGTASDFALTLHHPDGTLDTSFGQGGIAITDFGGAEDKALDAALTPDGGIVAVGEADPKGFLKSDFGIARYNADGTLDTSFGTGGIVTTDIRGDADLAEAVAVQPDGEIVVAGLAATVAGSITDFALVRYNPDGTLDQSFGSHGIVTTDISGDDAAVALGIQADGKITLVGTAGEHIALARYTPNGSLDPSFGTNGTAIYPGFGEARGLAVTPNGGIFIAGDSGGDFLLLSYRSDGTLTPGFGNAGTVTTDISGSGDFAENLAIDAQGRIILVGRATSSTILDMALARYNPDGTLDTSFANHGTLTADFHGEGDFGQDVARDSAGRIVAAGYAGNGGNTEFALMRANP